VGKREGRIRGKRPGGGTCALVIQDRRYRSSADAAQSASAIPPARPYLPNDEICATCCATREHAARSRGVAVCEF